LGVERAKRFVNVPATQRENDKQNVNVVPHLEKFLRTPMGGMVALQM